MKWAISESEIALNSSTLPAASIAIAARRVSCSGDEAGQMRTAVSRSRRTQ
jgi:hypothetical protein